MRKTITMAVIALTAFTVTSKAQLQQGNVLVGGDLGSLRLELQKGGTFQVNITPKAAWFIKDNIAVGGYVNLGLTSSGEDPKITTTNYGVGALGRYYINDPRVNVLEHGRFFLEGTAGIGGTNTNHGGLSTNGLNLGFGPGYAYFITPNIGIETLLKYDGLIGFGNTVTNNALTLNVGFQVYLPGKGIRNKLKRDLK